MLNFAISFVFRPERIPCVPRNGYLIDHKLRACGLHRCQLLLDSQYSALVLSLSSASKMRKTGYQRQLYSLNQLVNDIHKSHAAHTSVHLVSKCTNVKSLVKMSSIFQDIVLTMIGTDAHMNEQPENT